MIIIAATEKDLLLFMVIMQCEAIRCTWHMEKKGLLRSLAFTRDKGLTVRSLTTDRHRSIAKHLREKEPAILHFFDVWHVSKSKCHLFWTSSPLQTNSLHCSSTWQKWGFGDSRNALLVGKQSPLSLGGNVQCKQAF